MKNQTNKLELGIFIEILIFYWKYSKVNFNFDPEKNIGIQECIPYSKSCEIFEILEFLRILYLNSYRRIIGVYKISVFEYYFVLFF